MDLETDPVEKAKWEEKYQRKAALLQKQNKAYNDYCKETGLKKQSDRISIAKWDRSQAAKARAAAKKVQKSVDNPVGSGTIEMYHKDNKNELRFNPISDKRFNELTIEARKNGATILRGTPEIEEHLQNNGATASCVGNILLFRKNVCVSEVLEETHHFMQNKKKLNHDKDFKLREILNEIDAKEFIISNSKKYDVPRDEVEHIKRQLASYQEQLKNYLEG